MKIGSLFSGIGGLELGLELAGVGHTAWQVEQDEFCRAVLKKHWPAAAQYQDVREVGASNLERVEVVCGGFPCQDISQAGKGAGLGGARSGLYFEYLRVIQEISPRFVVIENVAALLRRGLDVVLSTLDESGYDASWSTIRASDVGARHRRDRLFVVAWKRTVVDDSRFGSGERAAENLGEASGSGWTQAGGAAVVGAGRKAMADASPRGIRRGSASGEARQPAQRGAILADADGEQRGRQGHEPVGIPASHARTLGRSATLSAAHAAIYARVNKRAGQAPQPRLGIAADGFCGRLDVARPGGEQEP